MSAWLPLIIIILAVTLVVGPVMWLKPSGRDRQLAGLRQRAAKAGMSVQMQSLPPALGEGTAAVYIQRWRDPRRLQTGWILELQRMSHELHFAGRWDWRKSRSAPEAAWEPLRELLAQLPEDACAVVASQGGLGVQWRENTGERGMTALEHSLPEFAPIIEEAIRQPRRDEESPE